MRRRVKHGPRTLTSLADDVRDIYRRAEKKELVVEGLREGESLAAE